MALVAGGLGSSMRKRTGRVCPLTSRGFRVAAVAATDSQPSWEVKPLLPRTCSGREIRAYNLGFRVYLKPGFFSPERRNQQKERQALMGNDICGQRPGQVTCPL